MPISPGTFDHYGEPLAKAAENLQLEIGVAYRDLLLALVKDPSQISRYRKRYEKSVARALKKWQKARKHWVEVTLPEAYWRGVKHADDEMKELRSLGVNIKEPIAGFGEEATLMQQFGG